MSEQGITVVEVGRVFISWQTGSREKGADRGSIIIFKSRKPVMTSSNEVLISPVLSVEGQSIQNMNLLGTFTFKL